MPTLIFSGTLDPITPLQLFLETPAFQRENIVMHEIENASHFPWMDEPVAVRELFKQYCARLRKRRI